MDKTTGKKTSMNIRMDSETKVQAQHVFSELGMDMTTAINIFLRQAIRNNGLPFEPTLNYPNSATLAALAEGDRLAKNPKAKRFASVDDLFEDLDN